MKLNPHSLPLSKIYLISIYIININTNIDELEIIEINKNNIDNVVI